MLRGIQLGAHSLYDTCAPVGDIPRVQNGHHAANYEGVTLLSRSSEQQRQVGEEVLDSPRVRFGLEAAQPSPGRRRPGVNDSHHLQRLQGREFIRGHASPEIGGRSSPSSRSPGARLILNTPKRSAYARTSLAQVAARGGGAAGLRWLRSSRPHRREVLRVGKMRTWACGCFKLITTSLGQQIRTFRTSRVADRSVRITQLVRRGRASVPRRRRRTGVTRTAPRPTSVERQLHAESTPTTSSTTQTVVRAA